MSTITIDWAAMAAKYGQASANNARAMVESGVSPLVIRELDEWTGAVHFEYGLPAPTGNVNINTVRTDAEVTAAQTAYQNYINTYAQAATTTQIGVTPTTLAPASLTDPDPKGDPIGTRTIAEQVKAVALASTGRSELSWDEWNYYWKQVVGSDGPAPEDRGWVRTAGGAVIIGGQSRYPFETWYNSAFGSVRGPGTAAASNGTGSSGGGGQSGTYYVGAPGGAGGAAGSGGASGAGGGGSSGAGTTNLLATLAGPSKALGDLLAGVLPENLKPQAAMIAAVGLIAAGLLLRTGGNIVRGALIGAGAAGLLAN